jgi:hypothetical protein
MSVERFQVYLLLRSRHSYLIGPGFAPTICLSQHIELFHSHRVVHDPRCSMMIGINDDEYARLAVDSSLKQRETLLHGLPEYRGISTFRFFDDSRILVVIVSSLAFFDPQWKELPALPTFLQVPTRLRGNLDVPPLHYRGGELSYD